jgi:hypothetical protein
MRYDDALKTWHQAVGTFLPPVGPFARRYLRRIFAPSTRLFKNMVTIDWEALGNGRWEATEHVR